MLKPALWNMLLLLAPNRYQAEKARRLGFDFPTFFDSTQSIFVHVPKAAGTSMAMTLYGMQAGHRTWREWNELNPRKFRRYFKFAVVRDPIARFASAFHFLQGGGMNAYDKEFGDRVLRPFSGPNEFAKALVDYDLQRVVLEWLHFRTQADYVADETGRPQTDLLVKFENLEARFEEISRRVTGQARPLPRLNATRGKGTPAFDDEAREVLGCIYRRDFVLWNEFAQ